MPTVDFTKAELLADMKQIFVTKDGLDARLLEEREFTQQMMADAFMSFWDSNLGPAFDELHGEFAQLKSRVSRLEREVRA